MNRGLRARSSAGTGAEELEVVEIGRRGDLGIGVRVFQQGDRMTESLDRGRVVGDAEPAGLDARVGPDDQVAGEDLRRFHRPKTGTVEGPQAGAIVVFLDRISDAMREHHGVFLPDDLVERDELLGALLDQLNAVKPIPKGPADVAVGIPADTLRQRADVRGAERSLAAATARIGVAEAELYPQLRLTGNIGTSAFSLGGLFDAVTGGIFAGLTQSIFEGGRLRSQVRSQRAATEAALATYHQSVLTALEDVENALAALNAAKAREAQFAIALDAANNSAILARSQYRAGITDFQLDYALRTIARLGGQSPQVAAKSK